MYTDIYELVMTDSKIKYSKWVENDTLYLMIRLITINIIFIPSYEIAPIVK